MSKRTQRRVKNNDKAYIKPVMIKNPNLANGYRTVEPNPSNPNYIPTERPQMRRYRHGMI